MDSSLAATRLLFITVIEESIHQCFGNNFNVIHHGYETCCALVSVSVAYVEKVSVVSC